MGPAAPAWPPSQADLQFDLAPNVIVADDRLIVGSTVADDVTAYDTETGRQQWRFQTNGPVRFAPAASNGRVYVVSDDGYLYCLELSTGRLDWKVRGGPQDRLVLGNERLVSAWPARGAPVIDKDRVYFAASIWPFMGIFIHCLDAQSGEIVWTNSGDGTNLTIQPHGAPAFASVAPQGYLVIAGDRLIVPGGRSVPAVFDKWTGKLLHFQYEGKRGAYEVFGTEDHYFVDGGTHVLATGQRLSDNAPRLAGVDHLVFAEKNDLRLMSTDGEVREHRHRDRRGREVVTFSVARETLVQGQASRPVGRVLMETGGQLWTTVGNRIFRFDISKLGAEKTCRPGQVLDVGDKVWDAVAGDDRLYVVTHGGVIFCFGAGKSPSDVPPSEGDVRTLSRVNASTPFTKFVVEQAADSEGHAFVLGIGSGALIDRLLIETRMKVTVVARDKAAATATRRRWRDDTRGRGRLSIYIDDHRNTTFPEYFAELVTTESQDVDSWQYDMDSWLRCVRPYGGHFCGAVMAPNASRLTDRLDNLRDRDASFQQFDLQVEPRGVVMIRVGPLPDTDDWTHQYANAAQTGISQEARVKAPLGVLWFGGPSHDGILPRHGHGPAPQVAGGRIVIEGPNLLRCLDVYTGRLLWQREFPGLGAYYDNTRHFPGAGEIGSNYVTTPDHVYVVYESDIHVLDASHGATIRKIPSPSGTWGYLGVSNNLLIATASPVTVEREQLLQNLKDAGVVRTGEHVIVPRHHTWRYLAGQDPPSTQWTMPTFDDSRWQLGESGFGYGDNDDRTDLVKIRNKHTRVYLRLRLPTLMSKSRDWILRMRYDDGFIAYLNGVEVARSPNVRRRGAAAKVDGHEATGFESFDFTVPDQFSLEDDLVLAIEAHNASRTSSDLSIDPVLVVAAVSAVEQKRAAGVAGALRSVRYASGSRTLVGFDRATGRKRWTRDAKFNFRHNNIALGNGRVFCVDRLSEVKRRALKRRGIDLEDKPWLVCLDDESGKVLWETDLDVFGTFLNYSVDHDVLIQGGSLYRDRAYDEAAKGMVAYRGTTGEVIWQDLDLVYGGPVLLWKNQVLTNGNGGFAIDIATGKRTGWSYKREYGCNTAAGCQNLLTFRSGAAGFYDLLHDSGTGNLGGFRSSCTNNLIPANGVLAAPDYTRTCQCAYQNQTSLALVHWPDAEFWTFGGTARPGRVGINFGAPGDRRASDGTLWVDYPDVGGASPPVTINVHPTPQGFRQHSSTVRGERRWICASGIEGVQRMTVDCPGDGEQRLRLYFMEPQLDASTTRQFTVKLQGEPWLISFSPAVAAGEPRHGVVRDTVFKPESGQLLLEFEPESERLPVISGLELIAVETDEIESTSRDKNRGNNR